MVKVVKMVRTCGWIIVFGLLLEYKPVDAVKKENNINVTPSEKTILFEELGNLAGVISMAHLIIPVNISAISDQVGIYCNVTSRLAQHYKQLRVDNTSPVVSIKSQTDFVMSNAFGQCEMLVNHVGTIREVWSVPSVKTATNTFLRNNPLADLDGLDLHSVSREATYQVTKAPGKRRRSKRQVLLGAGLLTVALSAFSSIYTQHQLESLSSQIHRANQFNVARLEKVAARVNLNSEAIKTIKTTVQTMIRAMEKTEVSLYNFAIATQISIGLNTLTIEVCLLYTSPSPRDKRQSRMPSSA